MKNVLKYYIAALYLCSTFTLFAQPGAEDNGTGLESTDTAAAPIDDYLWFLALVGLVFVFLRFRALAKQGNTQLK
ncbi:MAG: hypothetical protein H7Y10_06010 [Flavobacterium sp.]|nr:hypothetical protein [Flavobacterium sp.]